MIQPPFTEAHEAFRAQARFVPGELRPHADAWEAAGRFPNEVFGALAARGRLGLRYDGDWVADAVLAEELARCGSGGVAAGIGAHVHIATPRRSRSTTSSFPPTTCSGSPTAASG